MPSPVITVENLSKLYRIGLAEQRSETLAGTIGGILRSPLKNLRKLRSLTNLAAEDGDAQDVIQALKDVSFEVNQGEVLGVIGANGAGKTTLLRILTGITDPTSGRATVKGRVASLLEVGTGFHPDLTGRENIYLNGCILGMTKTEVDRKFDEIVAFSGVEQFIDTPVKRYSAGMAVRLAFAVAAHLEPEILLIDEVLAVGDAEFQKKCLGRMDAVTQQGRTVLFVSHNLPAVASLCQKGILLGRGVLVAHGPIKDVIAEYHVRMSQEDASDLAGVPRGVVKLGRLSLAEPEQALVPGSRITLAWDMNVHERQWGARVQLVMHDSRGVLVALPEMSPEAAKQVQDPGRYRLRTIIPPLWLKPGVYFAKVKVISELPSGTRRYYSDSLTFMIDLPEGESARGSEGVLSPACRWEVLTSG